mmetsp:Transcript_6724/g.6307  ORF Transcript_6724/g.6307 Transcript_6724/m.6307 type:complete len:107 (-) Transcript_6724:140-460(-)
MYRTVLRIYETRVSVSDDGGLRFNLWEVITLFSLSLLLEPPAKHKTPTRTIDMLVILTVSRHCCGDVSGEQKNAADSKTTIMVCTPFSNALATAPNFESKEKNAAA